MECLEDATAKGRRDHHSVFVENNAVVLAEVVAVSVVWSYRDRHVRRCLWEAVVDEINQPKHIRVAGGHRTHFVPGYGLDEVSGGGSTQLRT